MFALGWVASIAVRGIGTAYAIGWESTWLAFRSDLVATLLSMLYPLPGGAVDAAVAESLRFGASAGSGVIAADWLLRIITTILLFIWLPRGLLALAAHLKLRRARIEWPVEMTDINRTLQGPSLTLLLPQEAEKSWMTAAEQRSKLCVKTIDLWSESAADDLRSVAAPAALVLNAAATPEDDVHGRVLAALPKPATLILDADTLLLRFAPDSERFRSRLALWEHFAASRRVPVVTLPLNKDKDDIERRAQLLDALRTP